MTQTVTYTYNAPIAIIQMDDGKANALGHDMFDQLNDAFDQAEKDGAIVLFKGREGIFSGGYNLMELAQGPEEARKLVSRGSKLARRLLEFPTPVIGVATGHCIAMGAFLMLACDYRLGTDGKFKVGLNETAIGMQMHSFGIELSRFRLPKTHFNRCTINGELFPPQMAIAAGFYDTVVPATEIHNAADQHAERIAKLSLRAFKYTKQKSYKDLYKLLDKCIADDLEMEISLGG